MHLLSEDELMLYVDGLQQIRKNGKYQIMVDAHSIETEIHRGTSFFFYHTYFVWEVETQIRALGSKWNCFAVPYYDWTIDAGRERNPLILNTVFGGDGEPGNNNCVTDPHNKNLWGIIKWPVRELCNPAEDVEVGCCLKRNLDSTQKLSVASQMGPMLEVPFFHEFLGDILIEHQTVHWLFGSGEDCTACAMATGYSPDDPIFMMLHGFTAYLRALWAGCHGYDNIDPLKLDQHPEAFNAECIDGYDKCGIIELDDVYRFGPMVDQEWSLTSSQKITPRSMWDFSAWNVKYDHGTFYDESGLRNSDICNRQNIENSKWFVKLPDPGVGVDAFAADRERPQHDAVSKQKNEIGHSQDGKDQKQKQSDAPKHSPDAEGQRVGLQPHFASELSEADKVERAMKAMEMEMEMVDRKGAAEELSVKYRVKAIPVPKPTNTATILIFCCLLLFGAVYMLCGSSLMEYVSTRIKMKKAHIASPYKYDKVNANDIDADDEMYGAIE